MRKPSSFHSPNLVMVIKLIKLVVIIMYNRKRRLDALKTFFKHFLIVLCPLGEIDLILYSTGYRNMKDW